MKELPKPNMDIFELESTMKFIADGEARGEDMTPLKDYIKPLTNSKRVNLSYEQGKGLPIKQS